MGIRRRLLYVYWDKIEGRQYPTTTFPVMQERHSKGRYKILWCWKLKSIKGEKYPYQSPL
jgi:hypothetical protein